MSNFDFKVRIWFWGRILFTRSKFNFGIKIWFGGQILILRSNFDIEVKFWSRGQILILRSNFFLTAYFKTLVILKPHKWLSIRLHRPSFWKTRLKNLSFFFNVQLDALYLCLYFSPSFSHKNDNRRSEFRKRQLNLRKLGVRRWKWSYTLYYYFYTKSDLYILYNGGRNEGGYLGRYN